MDSGPPWEPALAEAMRGLKFSAALPPDLAASTLAARLADHPNAWQVLNEPR